LEKKKGGSHIEGGGTAWTNRAIIGCTLDLSKGIITFYKDGIFQTSLDAKRGSADHLMPCFAIDKGAILTTNFGHKPFIHMPMGYYPLHFNLGTEDRVLLEGVFDSYTAKRETWGSESKSGSSDYSSSETEASDQDEEGDPAELQEHMMLPTMGGTMKYLSDLNIDIGTDFTTVLLISWKLNVKKAFVFTREEFIIGWSIAGCKSLDQMRDKIAEWKKLIQTEQFVPFYKYCYKFFEVTKSKGVPVVDAVKIWDLVLKENNWAFYENWKSFLKSHSIISSDVWEGLLTFMEKYATSIEGVDPVKWPQLLVDFKSSLSS